MLQIMASLTDNFIGRHDTQHTDIQNKEKQHEWLVCDTQHTDIQNKDTQHEWLVCDTKHKWHKA
jgi:hypothetical protein